MSDHTPVWLAFLGAVAIAFIAAATAQWRQSRQLTHDREVKDLEELRTLLDECARMAGETSQLLIFMLNRAMPLPRRDSPEDTASQGRPMLLRELGVEISVAVTDYSADDPGFQKLEDAFYRATQPVFGLYQRIVLRLGREHSVSESFLQLQLEWVALGLGALLAETDPNTEEREHGIEYVRHELRAAHFGFLEAAHDLVQSRIAAATKRPSDGGGGHGGPYALNGPSNADCDNAPVGDGT